MLILLQRIFSLIDFIVESVKEAKLKKQLQQELEAIAKERIDELPPTEYNGNPKPMYDWLRARKK